MKVLDTPLSAKFFPLRESVLSATYVKHTVGDVAGKCMRANAANN